MTTALEQEIREGLTANPKRLPCRFFYDEEGSRLFELICKAPEYYVPAAENEILSQHAGEIVASAPAAAIVELGSGNAAKTRHLIAAALAAAGKVRYLPIDVSASAVEASTRQLLAEYPGLSVDPIVGEYEQGLAELAEKSRGPRLILWLGSNIGNLDREKAASFLSNLAKASIPRDRLLLGIDMRKDPALLEAAYNDAGGVTARFNLNILGRMNRELGADFDLGGFEHRALYLEDEGRVEMRLVALEQQTVNIAGLGMRVDIARGEFIHTESSYKYSADEIDSLALAAGLRIERIWRDSQERFSSVLLGVA